MNVTNWSELAREVIAYRDSKCFAPTTWVDLTTRICCLHSECRELEDALEEALDLTVRFEMADIAMYALTILSDLGCEMHLRLSYHGGSPLYCRPSEMTRPIRRHADDAFRAWRKGDSKDALVSVELVLVALVDLRQRVLGLPGTIADDVRMKIAESADRPRAHGKDPRS